MNRSTWRVGTLLATAVALTTSLLVGAPAVAETPDSDYSILVFNRTAGFAHPVIATATAAIQELGVQNDFTVDVTNQPGAFTDENLAGYDAIVFLNTTGNVLPGASERAALENYIRNGGGWAGFHAAADMGASVRTNWPFYVNLVGGAFKGHTPVHFWGPTPRFIYEGPLSEAPEETEAYMDGVVVTWEPATVNVEDQTSWGTQALQAQQTIADEWYGFLTNPRPAVRVLASLDESSYNPGPGIMGGDHPIYWCQNFEGGRSIYNGMGHPASTWRDPVFLDVARSMIEMAAGQAPWDCSPATAPAAPSSVVAEPEGTGFTISWAAPASTGGSDITGYRVYRDGVEEPIANLPAESTMFTVAGLLPGSTDRFAVSAINRVGESERSEWLANYPSFAAVRGFIDEAHSSGNLTGKALTEVLKHVDQAEKLAGGSAANHAVIAQLDNAIRKSGLPAGSDVVLAIKALSGTL